MSLNYYKDDIWSKYAHRTEIKIIEVKSLKKIIKQEKYRYVIPDEPNYQKKYSILNNQDIGINDESESLKEKLKNDLSSKINLLITNQKQNDNNFNLEEILNYLLLF